MPKNVNLNHFSMWRNEKKIIGLSPNSISQSVGIFAEKLSKPHSCSCPMPNRWLLILSFLFCFFSS